MVQLKLPNESTSLLASTEASFPRFTPINSFISCSPISLHAPAPYSSPHWHECQLESPTQAAQQQDQLFQNELRSSVARRPEVHRRFPRRFLHLVEYPCWHSPKATVPSGSRLWDGRRYRPYG